MDSGLALVTGASRGIGRGIALELARAGFDIAANATRRENLDGVCREVEALGRRCVPVPGDVGDIAAHEALLAPVLDSGNSIRVLVNNAGVAPKERLDILETSPDSFDRLMGINLRGPFFLTQRVARYMTGAKAAGNGGEDRPKPAIVFITSISADTASPERAEYCVSKAGLAMVAQNFAVRLAGLGINVYEVRPGIIATDMTAAVRDKYDRLIADGLVPQMRWGTPADVGRAVVALAQGSLDYATGAVIEVGGGMGLRRL